MKIEMMKENIWYVILLCIFMCFSRCITMHKRFMFDGRSWSFICC